MSKRTFKQRQQARAVRESYKDGFEVFDDISNFSVGILKLNQDHFDENKSKKIHIPIFPDLYDDLNQSEIDYESVQFLFSGKKNKDFFK